MQCQGKGRKLSNDDVDEEARPANKRLVSNPSGHSDGDKYDNILVKDGSIFQAGPTYHTNYYTTRSQNEKERKDKEEKCLQAFKTSSYEAQKDHNPICVKGTCGWVLNHPHFRDWRNNDRNPLLWISADPGCGKSVLSKSLADQELATEGNETICYFFFKDNEEQDNLSTALCALLHQLFAQQPHLVRHAIPAWEQNGQKLQSECRELWRILLSATADPLADPSICILDALDECRDNDRRRLIELLSSLQTQASRKTVRLPLKFVVTSRPYENIERWFHSATSSWPEMRVRGEDENESIGQEINLVIERRVEDLSKYFNLSGKNRKALHEQLLQTPHRTYLWLHLAIEEARQTYADSLYPDEEAISSLPSSVEDAYERLLQKITDQQRATARQVLLIIIGARRPLTTTEMALAVGAARAYREGGNSIIPPNKDHLQSQIRHWCGLFVFIQHDRLFLIHQTAKEFLLAQKAECAASANIWRSSFILTDVEKQMAHICTTYLLARNESSNIERRDNQFWRYCAETWASHAQGDDILAADDDLRKKAVALSIAQGASFSWFAEVWKNVRHFYSDKVDGNFDQHNFLTQHVMAFNGHTKLLREIFAREKIDVNMLHGAGNTALMWAAGGGHLGTVQLLLNEGSDVNARSRRATALHEASLQGQEQIVKILLHEGAEIDALDLDGHTALYHAAEHGFDGIVQLLLQSGADVNRDVDESDGALRRAIHNGHERTVQMLLQAGATVELKHRYDGTPLQVAARLGQEQIVQILLRAGADVNASESYIYGTALQAASQIGHERVVQILLQAGAHVNAKSWLGGTALKTASLFQKDDVIQILLAAGAIQS